MGETEGEVLDYRGETEGEVLNAKGKWVRRRGRGRGRETRQRLKEDKAKGELGEFECSSD